MIREMPAGRGFADVVFLPLPSSGKPALVIELKYDKTADSAIQQIKDRKYTQALEDYTGKILLVGIKFGSKLPNTDWCNNTGTARVMRGKGNYDKNRTDKSHSCVIEPWEKSILPSMYLT